MIQLQPVGFANHMKTRARNSKASKLYIGEDFAVFEYDSLTLVEDAMVDFKNLNSMYGYTIESRRWNIVVLNSFGEITKDGV